MPSLNLSEYADLINLGKTCHITICESDTEPKISVMVEAESDAVCEKYVDSVIEVIKAKGI